jgi:hypothetical protein
MANMDNELHFSPLKRRKLINLLSEAGFILVKRETGNAIHISNPQKWHPKFGDNYLPVAFMKRFYIRLTNLDEEYFSSYHRKIRAIYDSVVD